MYINKHELSEYGANLLMEYAVSGSAISNSYYKGRNRSGFVHYMNDIGLKTITLPLVFVGADMHEIAYNKSRLDAELLGKNELYMGDNFWYTVMLDDAGTLAWKSEQLAECEYALTGYQHGALVISKGNYPFCLSTAPVTDCILTATVSADTDRYHIGNATFISVKAGDVLTLDGIDKRVLVNGGPAAQRCDFVRLPFLTPGRNAIDCADQLKVEYYPIYQ